MLSRYSAAVGLLLLAGCGPTASGAGQAAGTWTPLASAEIVRTRTGQRVSYWELINALLHERVVYIGERHDRPGDHRIEAAIVASLYSRERHMTIGFEMIQRPFQPALSRYEMGRIDEAELQREVEWSSRWGYDFEMYAPLFRYGPERGVTLVALNAAQETTRVIAQGGIEALDDEVREALPELHRDRPAHRARVLEALREHPGMTDEMLERFYTAQLVWDETMAAEVLRALDEDFTRGQLIVIAGAMHTARDAIPERAARHGRGGFVIIELADELPDEARADYVWLTEPQ